MARVLFVASRAFFMAFGILRGITYSIHHNAGPFRNIVVGKVHIHHLVWGVLLLLGVSFLGEIARIPGLVGP